MISTFYVLINLWFQLQRWFVPSSINEQHLNIKTNQSGINIWLEYPLHFWQSISFFFLMSIPNCTCPRIDQVVEILLIYPILRYYILIDMSSFLKNLYPEMQSSMSVMIGKGYCFWMITLLSECKSVTWRTRPSFFGIMKAGDAHSEAPHGSRMPSSTCGQAPF